MRTIKFRGFGAGKWRYGYYVHFDERPLLSVIYNPKFRDFIMSQDKYGEHAIPVDPETVGQFTGLYDKNDKEIYEGDILKNNISNIPFGVVTWHHDGYFFIDIEFGKYPIRTNFRPLGEMLNVKLGYGNVKDVTFEVIGNITDNKELLTQN